MKSIVFSFFLVIFLVILIPQVDAQSDLVKKADQKLVLITIEENGDVAVLHQIKNSIEPTRLDFINGTISNLRNTNQLGMEEPIELLEGENHIVILPEQGELQIEYELDDVLVKENNVWVWDFLYVEKVVFKLPDEVDLVFVNDRPAHLGEKDGFVCHGCQMILEYSTDEPKSFYEVDWVEEKFLVEIKTFSEIDNFDFSQPEKKISFQVNNENQFLTAVIPLELLWEPYTVFLEDQEISVFDHINNGTHVWLNMKLENSGEIEIIGTTVIPEFPIFAPLAIGLMIILVMPLVRKFNLR